MTLSPTRRHPLVALAFVTLIATACRSTPSPDGGMTSGASPSAPFRVRPGVVLVANQQSGDVSIIDLATGSAQRVAVGTGPHEAAISPDGRWGVATVYGGQQPPGNKLAILDLNTATVVRTIDLGVYTRPHDVEFIPGSPSKVVVTSETTRKILIVDINTGAIEGTIDTNAAGSHMLGITDDARRVFTANVGAGGISELDLGARQFIRQVATASLSEGVAVTPDGREVWVGSNNQGTVTIVDAASGTVVQTLTGFTFPYRLTTTPDGKTVIVCDPEAGRIVLIDRATRAIIGDVAGLASPRGAMVARDNRTAVVTLGTEAAIVVVDLVTRQVVQRIGVGASPDGVAIHLRDAR